MGELLISLPLTDASPFKVKKETPESKGWLKKLQGLFTIDRDNLLKTCQGPFRATTATVAGGSGSVYNLTGKKGVCFFIHSVGWGVGNLAAVAASGEFYLSGKFRGEIINFSGGAIVTSKDSTCNKCDTVDLQFDENTAISMTWGVVPPSYGTAYIMYCEVLCWWIFKNFSVIYFAVHLRRYRNVCRFKISLILRKPR